MVVNPLALKAAAFAFAAFVLLVPTFNALNNSHFEATEPPFRLNPPDDYEPPDDVPPPDGEGDVEVPQDVPVPAEGAPCEKPTVRTELAYRGEFRADVLDPSAQSETPGITIRPGAAIVTVHANFSTFTGTFRYTLSQPDGTTELEYQYSPRDGPILDGPYRAASHADRPSPPGTWTFNWIANPTSGAGNVDVNVGYPVCPPPSEEPA